MGNEITHQAPCKCACKDCWPGEDEHELHTGKRPNFFLVPDFENKGKIVNETQFVNRFSSTYDLLYQKEGRKDDRTRKATPKVTPIMTPKTPKSTAAGDNTGAFVVQLARTDTRKTLGLLVSPDNDPRYLVVEQILEKSMISDWNRQRKEAERVRPGSKIVSVNGSTCAAEGMLELIQASGEGSILLLTVQH